mgnify:CR=1 FL=1
MGRVVSQLQVDERGEEAPVTRTRRFFLTALVTAVLSSPLEAQLNATLRGIVVDAMTGAPMKGVTVQLEPKGPSTTTDAGGLFSFKVKAGTFQIVATMKGYGVDKSNVQVAAGAAKDVAIALVKK